MSEMYADAFGRDPDEVFRTVPFARLLYWITVRTDRLQRQLEAQNALVAARSGGTGQSYSEADLAGMLRSMKRG